MTNENIRAVKIRGGKGNFKVTYENGKTLLFDIGYMDRRESDFAEEN